MANPPITIGELTDVPAPGSGVKSAWSQEVTSRAIHRFATIADRDTRWPAATAGRGAMCVTLDTDSLWKVGQVGASLVWQFAGPGAELMRAAIAANVSITATSVGTAQVIVTGSAITLDGSPIWVEAYLPGITQPNVANGQMVINLFDGAVDQGNMAAVYAPVATGMQIPAYTRRLITPTAGAHTYSLRAWVNPSGSALVVAGSVYPQGFLRVVKA